MTFSYKTGKVDVTNLVSRAIDFRDISHLLFGIDILRCVVAISSMIINGKKSNLKNIFF